MPKGNFHNYLYYFKTFISFNGFKNAKYHKKSHISIVLDF